MSTQESDDPPSDRRKLYEHGFTLEVTDADGVSHFHEDVIDYGVAWDVDSDEEIGLRVEIESSDRPLLYPDFLGETLRREE